MKTNKNGNKNDMSHNQVTLDLNAMIRVCEIAVSHSREAVNRQKNEIDNHISEAYRLKDSDPMGNYHNLCNANTETEFFMREAQAYADSVSMLFYLTEAKKREEVILIKE